MIELGEHLTSNEATVRANARAVVDELAGRVGISERGMLNLISTVALDGQAQFLRALWHDAFAEKLRQQILTERCVLGVCLPNAAPSRGATADAIDVVVAGSRQEPVLSRNIANALDRPASEMRPEE